MSSLDKLLIRGVRSFSPDNRASIQFSKPLTLIVGQNGAGKTTIIECLKYATTGNTPPGGLSTFLAHPKVRGEREVKSQIKLRFFDVAGQECIVARSLEVKQNKSGKLSAKTIDTAVRINGPEGPTALTKKCGDVDAMLPQMLGVSAAILDNVIFCHQDDEWVLATKEQFKKRLDAIFDSTRYRDALKNIKDQTKAQKHAIDVFKAELTNESNLREQALKLQDQAALVSEEIASYNEQRESVETMLAPLAAELETLEAMADDIAKLETTVSALEATIDVCQRKRDDLTAKLSEEFTESTEELQKLQSKYDSQIEAAQAEVTAMEAQVVSLNAELGGLEDAHTRAVAKHAQVQANADALAAQITERTARAAELAAKLKLTRSAHASPDAFAAAARAALVDAEAALTAQRQTNGPRVKEAEAKVNSLRVEDASLKRERAALSRTTGELKSKLRSLNVSGGDPAQALATLQASLDSAKSKARDADAALASLANGPTAAAAAQAELDAARSTKGTKSRELAELRDELTHRSRFSGKRAELQARREETEAKTQQAAEAREAAIAAAVDTTPLRRSDLTGQDVDALGKAIEEAVAAIEADAAGAADASATAAAHKASLEEQLAGVRDELAQVNSSIKRDTKKLAKRTRDGDLEDLIKRTQERKDKLRTKLQTKTLTSSAALSQYKEFLEMAQADSCCPLCQRGFEAAEELAAFLDSLKAAAASIQEPRSNESLEAEIAECDTILAKLNEWRPLKTQLETMKSVTAPKLEAKIAELSAQLEAAAQLVDSTAAAAVDADKARSAAVDTRAAVQTMLRVHAEAAAAAVAVRTKTAELDAMESASASAPSSAALQAMTQDALSARVAELVEQVTALESQISQLEASASARMQEQARAESASASAREAVLRLENETERAAVAVKMFEETNGKLAAVAAEMAGLDERARTLPSALGSAESELARVQAAASAAIGEAEGQVRALKDAIEWNGRVAARIGELETSAGASVVAAAAADVAQARSQVDEVKSQRKAVDAQISEVRSLLAESDQTKRLIDDNIAYRAAGAELDELSAELDKNKRRLRELRGPNSSDTDINTLRRNTNKLQTESATLQGILAGKEQQLAQLNLELQDPRYADASANYSSKVIELKTTEMAQADLSKYQRALDAALQRYHALKMTEVNNIIRELWHTVYKGSDIEYIEISCTESSSGRSSYDYQLMAVRDRVAIPMRARCSAGQARMASLIVRLALAESFGLRCGFITLDEPTSNLDYANKMSFARALAGIVNSRGKSQSNFQLIVITHDERWVSELTKKLEGPPDHVWEVVRDADGNSSIEFQDLA